MPQQHTTGGKPRLVGITKRGNYSLRHLFVQGARALWVWKEKHPDTPLQCWLVRLAQCRHVHVAVVIILRNSRRQSVGRKRPFVTPSNPSGLPAWIVPRY
ncbi:hypothetical protein IHE33_14610 (plasmid) [Mycetohabitans endofungorum]